MFMTNEQIGIYVRLLCAQHQHGAMIEEKAFNSLVKDDELLRSKFIKCEGGYYNERLMHEMSLRNKKSSNISSAMKEVWEKRKIESQEKKIESYNNPKRKLNKKDAKLIGIENENEDENVNTNKIELVYPFSSENFMKVWNVLIKQPKWKRKSQDALQASLKQLSKYSEKEAIEMMERSIAGNWQGLFEQNKSNEKRIAKGQPDTEDAVNWALNVLSGNNNTGMPQM